MIKNLFDKRARTIEFKSPNKKMFFLIHGYTGSPTDFNKFGYYLHKRFNANVKIMRIIGHGTNINDLDNLNYIDFLNDVEKELRREINKGMKIVIGGLCFGSLVAFDFAARYPVRGVFSASATYRYRFIVNILRFILPEIVIKHVKKPVTEHERIARIGTFNYPYVHLRGFRVVSQAKKRLKHLWKKITAPTILIHSTWDSISSYKSDEIIASKISSKNIKKFIFSSRKEGEHNLFYSPYHKKVYKLFGDFFKKNKVFD